MKKTVLVLCLIFFLSASLAQAERMNTYKNEDSGFTLKYPSNWEKREISGLTAFISPLENDKDLFRENVSVGREDISKYPITLVEYIRISLDNWRRQTPELKMLGKSKVKIDKKDTTYVTCQTGNTKHRQYYLLHENVAYVLTYTATEKQFDSYLKSAEKIIKSLKIN